MYMNMPDVMFYERFGGGTAWIHPPAPFTAWTLAQALTLTRLPRGSTRRALRVWGRRFRASGREKHLGGWQGGVVLELSSGAHLYLEIKFTHLASATAQGLLCRQSAFHVRLPDDGALGPPAVLWQEPAGLQEYLASGVLPYAGQELRITQALQSPPSGHVRFWHGHWPDAPPVPDLRWALLWRELMGENAQALTGLDLPEHTLRRAGWKTGGSLTCELQKTLDGAYQHGRLTSSREVIPRYMPAQDLIRWGRISGRDPPAPPKRASGRCTPLDERVTENAISALVRARLGAHASAAGLQLGPAGDTSGLSPPALPPRCTRGISEGFDLPHDITGWHAAHACIGCGACTAHVTDEDASKEYLRILRAWRSTFRGERLQEVIDGPLCWLCLERWTGRPFAPRQHPPLAGPKTGLPPTLELFWEQLTPVIPVMPEAAHGTLVHAAGRGALREVQRALTRGADPRAREVLSGTQPAAEPAGVRLLADLTSVVSPATKRALEALCAVKEAPGHKSPSAPRPLDWAVMHGHLAVARVLLKHDPGLVDLPGLAGRTALMAASFRGDLPIVDLLLRAGADPRAQDPRGVHALQLAAAGGHKEVVLRLLSEDPLLIDLPGTFGHTALMDAASFGRSGVVELLLNRGASTTARDAWGLTGLDHAAEAGETAMVAQLIKADPGSVSRNAPRGCSVLQLAAGAGQVEAVRLLLAAGADARAAGEPALISAARRGRRGVVDALLAHDRGLLDLPDATGATALLAAVFSNADSLAEHLIAQGADPAQRSPEGEHVMNGLLRHERWELIIQLLDKYPVLWDYALNVHVDGGQGCTIEIKPGEGWLIDALIVAGQTVRVRWLLERYPDRINVSGWHRATPLMLAAGTGQEGLLRWLLNRGAKTDASDAYGDHALLYALDARALGCAQVLIGHAPNLMHRPGAGGRTVTDVIVAMPDGESFGAI